MSKPSINNSMFKTSINPITAGFFAVILTLLLTASFAFAQHNHSSHGSTPRQIYSTDGVVVEIDAPNARLVVDHGPIPAVGWGPMTMGFMVADPSLLEGLKVGDKVTIDVAFEGQNYFIADLEVIN
jgi:Cu/Ag efflux protein CusF